MAGAGYKQFADGDVLTAAQVQTYLQDQAVMRFADSSARTSGLGTAVAEGMVSYLQDTDSVEVYDGSAWVGLGAAGIGSNVAQTAKSDTFSTSATSYTAVTGLSVSITPTSSSSKVLVIANVLASAFESSVPTARYGYLTVYRNASAMLTPASPSNRSDGIASFIDPLENGNVLLPYVMVYLDSPATTSATTYAVYGAKAGLSTLYVNRTNNDTDNATQIRGVSTITAIEVAA